MRPGRCDHRCERGGTSLGLLVIFLFVIGVPPLIMTLFPRGGEQPADGHRVVCVTTDPAGGDRAPRDGEQPADGDRAPRGGHGETGGTGCPDPSGGGRVTAGDPDCHHH